MKNVSVFAYATFGSPNGFTQSCIYGNKSLEKVLKTFDLKTNAIQLLSPNDRIYSIRKELVQNNVLVSYSVYTFAKERNSNRGGTFIGTSLVFTNQIPTENIILSSLHGIHQNLKNANTTSNVLNIIHSKELNLENIFPQDFEILNLENKELNFSDWDNSEKNLVVFVDKLDPNTIQNVFKKSLYLLSDYYTVYFIDSTLIADFVTQKRLLKLVNIEGLDQEIQNLKNEKKQKLLNKIAELENAKVVLEENRQKQYAEFAAKINQNEEKQFENKKKIDESKVNLKALNTLYESLSTNIEHIIGNLKTNNKLEEANLLYKQNRITFEKELSKIENVSSIQSISTPKSKTSFPQRSWDDSPYSKSENSHQKKEPKLDNGKIISFALNFLLIAGIAVFFLFFYDVKEPAAVSQTVPTGIAVTSDSIKPKLNPIPDDILSAKDYKLIYRNLKKDATINDVANVIFEKNPMNVGIIYRFQKKDYVKLLLEKNPKSFNKLNDTLFIVRDSIKVIPSLKVK